MTSHTTERFRKALEKLPQSIRRQAREAYKLFRDNPYHPSLHFKQVHPVKPVYSVRIGRDYRAVGVCDRDEMVWFWIGSHGDYNKIIARL